LRHSTQPKHINLKTRSLAHTRKPQKHKYTNTSMIAYIVNAHYAYNKTISAHAPWRGPDPGNRSASEATTLGAATAMHASGRLAILCIEARTAFGASRPSGPFSDPPPQPTRPNPGSGPSERGEHRPIEWGRRVLQGFVFYPGGSAVWPQCWLCAVCAVGRVGCRVCGGGTLWG